MEFVIILKAEVSVAKIIYADTWDEALAKAKRLTILEVIPTPKDFTFDDFSETEVTGIFK